MPMDSPQAMNFYGVLDVVELWAALGADLPGLFGHLKWRGRCLLVSAQAFRPRSDMLRRLRAQQEIDDLCGEGSESPMSFPRTPSWHSLPSWYEPSENDSD